MAWWEEATHTETFTKTGEATAFVDKATAMPEHAAAKTALAEAVKECAPHETANTKCKVTWKKGVFEVMQIVNAQSAVIASYPTEDEGSNGLVPVRMSDLEIQALIDQAGEEAKVAKEGTQVAIRALLLIPVEEPDGTKTTREIVVQSGPIGGNEMRFVLPSPVELGTPNAFIKWVNEKFGASVDTTDQLAEKVPAELQGVRDALKIIGNIRLIIDRLVIDQPSDFYKFGILLRLPPKPALTVGPIELREVGFLITKKGPGKKKA